MSIWTDDHHGCVQVQQSAAHIRRTHRLHIEQWCARGGFDFWHLLQNGSGALVALADEEEVMTTSSMSTAELPSALPGGSEAAHNKWAPQKWC